MSKKSFRLPRRINSKLFFSIGFATILIFAVLSYLFLSQQKEEHTERIYREARILSEIITRATRFNMPIGNRECVHRMMQIIGDQKGIEMVRMFEKKGMIKFSTNKSEVGTFVDMNAEACNTCHAQVPPLATLPQKSRYRTFRAKDNRILAIITPIYNGPTCYTGKCHVHTKAESILGVLDVGMSLAEVDDETKEIQFIFILFTIIAILCFSSILAFFIQRLVTNPVKQLVNATEKVAAGNLDIEIPIKTGDEMGQLAVSFNHMVQDLKKANEKLQSWSSQLEKKVEERTEKLRMAREQLIQSEKMASMGVLASSVAHEINNPLQGILTYIKLMLKILAGEKVDEKRVVDFQNYLQLMGGEIERCGDMVKNLLVFSKQTKLNIQETNINNIIKNSLQLVENKIKLQNIEVVLNLQEDLPAIYCDIKQIQQTLIAVIINAAEAMSENGKLRIDSRRLADGQVEILIADTGAGISKDNLKKIFDPFFTTKEAAKSTGLGLFVAYGIIKEHKGTIEVESEPGKGTTFHIKLPTKIGK